MRSPNALVQRVEQAVWGELHKRRWFGKHVEDEAMEALGTDMRAAITAAVPDITILHDEGGDWIAVYKDGVKVEENHSCDIRRGLESLGIPFSEREVVTDQHGGLPDGTDPYPEIL